MMPGRQLGKSSVRTITILVGVLYLAGTVAGILSVAPVIDKPDYLISISSEENQVLFAAFFQFVMAVAYTGFAVTLYPLLRKYNESLAFGFAGSRIIASVFVLTGVILLLLLNRLSLEYTHAGTSGNGAYQVVGELLRSGRDYINHIAMTLTLSSGSLLLYIILIRTKSVPLWLSVWGVAAAAISIVAGILYMFGVLDLLSSVYMVIPLGVQEIFLAVRLIVKGMDLPEIEILTQA